MSTRRFCAIRCRRPTAMLGLLTLLAACGSGDGQQATGASGQGAPVATSAAAAAAIAVSLVPPEPVSGDCLTIVVKGRAPGRKVSWFLDGALVQSGEVGQYCLSAGARGKVVRVVLGEDPTGPVASVTIGNAPPEVLDTQLKLITEGRHRFLESVPVISDADDDDVTLAYQWYVNGELNPLESRGRLALANVVKGDLVRLDIIPNDGTVDGQTYSTVESPVPGTPPLITSQPPRSFLANEFRYQVKAEDPDGDPLHFSLENPPPGAGIDAKSGLLTWPLTPVTPGEYKLVVVVTDPDGLSDIQSFPLQIVKDAGN